MDLLKNIVHIRPLGRSLVGLDVGTKTIGIALSDATHSIATPLRTIKRTKFTNDLKEIEKVARDYRAGGYVLGYPINMDGSEGARCQSVRDFGLELIRQSSPELRDSNGDVWVALWDERLSTASVEDFVHNSVNIKKSRAKERGILDKLAAQHVLQGALDFIQNAAKI